METETTGVKDLKDFDFSKQVKAVCIEFIPERTKLFNGTYTRAFVDSDELEWIELGIGGIRPAGKANGFLSSEEIVVTLKKNEYVHRQAI